MNGWMQYIGGLAWRDWLLLLIALTAAYMLLVTLRLRRVGRELPEPRFTDARSGADIGGAKEVVEPMIVADRKEVIDISLATMRASRGVETVSDELVRDPIALVARLDSDRAAIERLQRDGVRLMGVVDELQKTVTAITAECDALRQEIASLKAGQQVSPLYGDSMQMALAGASAEVISARCGIARAEAELVVGLANNTHNDGAGGLPGMPDADMGVTPEENVMSWGGQGGRSKRFG